MTDQYKGLFWGRCACIVLAWDGCPRAGPSMAHGHGMPGLQVGLCSAAAHGPIVFALKFFFFLHWCTGEQNRVDFLFVNHANLVHRCTHRCIDECTDGQIKFKKKKRGKQKSENLQLF